MVLLIFFDEIKKIYLTASGGPFLKLPIKKFNSDEEVECSICRMEMEHDDEYFDMLTEQGSLGFAPCYSNHYSRLELNIYKYLIWIAFYSISLICRPKRILKLINDLFKQQGSTRLSMGLINLSKRLKASAVLPAKPAKTLPL